MHSLLHRSWVYVAWTLALQAHAIQLEHLCRKSTVYVDQCGYYPVCVPKFADVTARDTGTSLKPFFILRQHTNFSLLSIGTNISSMLILPAANACKQTILGSPWQ